MRERAAASGGRLLVSVENGLRLELRLPMNETKETA
jgi:signal transduction histidine kinase